MRPPKRFPALLGTALAVVGCLASAAPQARAENGVEVEGRLGFEARYYPEDGLLAGQTGRGTAALIGGSLRLDARTDSGRFTFQLEGRHNGDSGDGYIDIPRGYYQHFGEGWDLLIGSNIEYWGVSEGNHVVDVVNQRFTLDQPLDYTSLGQPMVNLNVATGLNGTLSLFGLLEFRDRDTGTAATRFRAPFVLDRSGKIYEEGSGRDLDFALRYRTSFGLFDGSADLAVSYFEGTNRAPSALPSVCINPDGSFSLQTCVANLQNNPGNLRFVPYYQKLRQYGLEFVYALGDVQFTFEGAFKQAMGEDVFSGIGGLQYTLHGVGPNGGTLLLIGEYHYDDGSLLQPLTLYQDDLFLGFAYSGNDIAGTAVTGGIYHDFESDARIYSLSYSRRLGDAARLNVAGIYFDAEAVVDPLILAQNDAYLSLSIDYFF